MGKTNLVDDPSNHASSSDPGYNGYPISKHRSCWLHVVWSLKVGKMKITKRRLKGFELSAPCLLANIPCRERSKRRPKSKNSVPKQKKRLDTAAFEFYMDFPEDKRICFTRFDCQWFTLYMNAKSRIKVLSWIKRKQIFSKKYVVIPLVFRGHWSLLILCHFGESLQSKSRTPCMLLLDSLQTANPRRLEPDIRKFVFDIYRAQGRPEKEDIIYKIPLLVPKVPQQRDGEECGNFVLYYINLFVEGAPDNFSIKDYPYFMRKDWFDAERLDRFCERLHSFGRDFW